MRVARFSNELVLVFARGERFIETLTRYLERERITAARFTGIGAFSQAQIKYFDVERKQYEQREVDAQVEVISLIGNVALREGKPFIHAHVCLGDREYRALAGHLGEGTVSPTLELFLTRIKGELTRRHDDASGLDALHAHPEAEA
jgi:predicted DNA-binding protein with PD1-like motif